MNKSKSLRQEEKDHFCVMTFVSEIIGNTWVLLIINQLSTGAKRFKDLQENISGLNSSTLTDKLKMLEERKLIIREVFPEIPVRVEYSLSKQGKELTNILGEMQNFGDKYYRWCVKNKVVVSEK